MVGGSFVYFTELVPCTIETEAQFVEYLDVTSVFGL